MSFEDTYDIPQWYVIHTHPRQEERADSVLKAWDVETLYPKSMERRYNEFTLEPSCIIKPFFPGYIFARFRVSKLYHKVLFTRGVRSVISFGDKPTAVDDRVIQILKSQMNEGGVVRVSEKFRPGEEVMITGGPFRNFIGVFEREMKESDRVMVLLEMVNYQAHIVVEKANIKKISLG